VFLIGFYRSAAGLKHLPTALGISRIDNVNLGSRLSVVVEFETQIDAEFRGALAMSAT